MESKLWAIAPNAFISRAVMQIIQIYSTTA
jgi:hypothetical protein